MSGALRCPRLASGSVGRRCCRFGRCRRTAAVSGRFRRGQQEPAPRLAAAGACGLGLRCGRLASRRAGAADGAAGSTAAFATVGALEHSRCRSGDLAEHDGERHRNEWRHDAAPTPRVRRRPATVSPIRLARSVPGKGASGAGGTSSGQRHTGSPGTHAGRGPTSSPASIIATSIAAEHRATPPRAGTAAAAASR